MAHSRHVFGSRSCIFSRGSAVNPFVPILILIVVAILFGAANLAMSHMLGPRRRSSPQKLTPYECGVRPVGDARTRIPIHYYLVAILFIIFDIEIVFLFPWAVVFRDLGLYGLVEMMIFLGILAVGFIYVWRKGALDWGS